MTLTQQTLQDFTAKLASGEPVPGGGGASALVGAVGAALCAMVGNFTVGRKKYAAVEADVRDILTKTEVTKARLLSLVEEDAAAFAPLAAAYAIPKDDPTRAAVMESALQNACAAPLDMMRCCCQALDLLANMLDMGNTMLLSDVGVGALCCKAALIGASMNVYINTQSMADRNNAAAMEDEADGMLAEYGAKADVLSEQVMRRVRKED